MCVTCGYDVPGTLALKSFWECCMNEENQTGTFGAETSLDLMRRARAGSAEARDRLYERYLPFLRRFATGRLPGGARSLIDTDDIVQETAIRTMQRLDVFEPERPGALMAYMRQAILNRIRDEARRARRRPPGGEPGEDEPDRGTSPVEAAIGHEAEARYEAALRRLKSEDREAVVARIEMGLDYGEAAEALGKPSPDAARMQISRALVRLAREMERP
ncbi:MAG: sigma-70 family RNA polymerase sigma factor [Planctomycetes bacterium]|nr:sigma-70 family RNA polymerase sigma factor [Planctomycetota bacterium]